MSKVHLLPPDIISKIAAGEVIDRPASVIKELLENAIDAKADTIKIHIEQAGKTSITIKDNGTGIAEDDLEKIFQRHSTSKIQTADDLFDIHSLGFRGEALYSICAVADIVVRSKPRKQNIPARGKPAQQDSGWEIHMRGGEKLNLKPVAIPDGTEIEVKELFFNTPARRKFLKSNTSEMNQALDIVIPYALLHPQCRFCLTHGNKTILDLPPTDDLAQRIASVLNLNRDFFVEAQREIPEDSISLHMIMGDINILRSKRDMQFIFINGRPVQSKGIGFHMNDIFRLIAPPRHYPFFAISIVLPAANVDVNIHPTKREVKIHDEQKLCSIIRRMCEHALMNKAQPKKIFEVPDIAVAPDTQRPSVKRMIDSALKERSHQEAELEKTFEASFDTIQPPTEQYSFPQTETTTADFTEHLFAQKQQTLSDKLKGARFIGSFLNKYLFYESEKILLVLDQHAAQERIMFEHFIKQMEDSRIEVQQLLAPYVVNVSPQELLTWKEGKERLEKIGFDTTQFDNETIAIQSHPALITNPEAAVRELLANGDVARCDHETIARRACRASVMAGDALSKQQAEYQREQLLQCRNPFTCPHGRPVVVEITSDFLDKQFLRT